VLESQIEIVKWYCPAGRDREHDAVGHHKMGNV